MIENADRIVMVVRIPDRSTLDEREFRDYIDESIRAGKLVIRESVTFEFVPFPKLGGVQVNDGQETAAEGTDGETADSDPAEPDSQQQPKRKRKSEAEIAEAERLEKRRIMDRFRNYRKLSGLGCFNPLAQRCGISASELRDLHNGVTVADLKTLKKIDKGLDKMDFEVAADG